MLRVGRRELVRADLSVLYLGGLAHRVGRDTPSAEAPFQDNLKRRRCSWGAAPVDWVISAESHPPRPSTLARIDPGALASGDPPRDRIHPLRGVT